MRKSSLQIKITALFIVSYIAISFFSIYSFNSSLNKQEDMTVNSLAENIETLKAQIGAQFFERYGDVQAFAQNSIFETNNSKLISEKLDQFVKLYGIYDLIIFVGRDGKYIASNSLSTTEEKVQIEKLKNHNFSKDEWFQETINQHWTEDKTKGFTGTYLESDIIDPYLELAFNRKDIATTFSTIVRNQQGEIIGLISNRTNFSWVEKEIQNIYKSLIKQNFNNSEIQLINKEGLVLIDYDPIKNKTVNIIHDYDNVILKLNLAKNGVKAAQEIVAGRSGHGKTYHFRKKIDQIGGWAPITDDKFISSIGWGIMIRSEADQLFKSIINEKLIFSFKILICMILGLSISFFVIKSVSTKISDLINEIYIQSRDLKNTSDQLSNSGQTVSTATSENVSALGLTTSAIDQILSTVKQNSEKSNKTKLSSEKSSYFASVGEKKISTLIDAINQISYSSSKIKEIINVIDDISFQTNILALNASVEAARAGEHGKGFSVVAEAVRGLAQKSSLAAKDITALIVESHQIINQGVSTANETNETYSEIIKQLTSSANLIFEIAEGSKQQEEGISQVLKALLSIDEQTKKTSVAANELAKSSEDLNTQSKKLEYLANQILSEISGKSL